MKISSNEKLIKRNHKIGQVATMASLTILAVGLYLSFKGEASSSMIVYAFIALLVGFILSQIGVYYGNHWGKRPRADEQIDAALKGLDDKYYVFHYRTPAQHLLLGPAGIWIILPYSQAGKITYTKGKWHQKGGNFYLKLFGQEGLGRPDLDMQAQEADLRKYLNKKNISTEDLPEIQSLLLFTNDKAEMDVENPPVPAITIDKFKDFIRRKSKEKGAAAEKISLIAKALS